MGNYNIDISPYIDRLDFAVRFDSADEAEAFLAAVREADRGRCSFWDEGEAAKKYEYYRKSNQDLTMILNYTGFHGGTPSRNLLQCDHSGWVEDLHKPRAMRFSSLLILDEIEESDLQFDFLIKE